MKTIKNQIFTIQNGTAALVVLFIISTTAYSINVKRDIDSRLDTMENQYDHVHKWYGMLDIEAEAIKDSNQEQDLVLVEIRTKLSNIETILIELKQRD